MKPEFVVLGLILIGALYCFWTQRLRTDITALLVTLTLALPWPRMDGKWSAILSPQEAFSGFGTPPIISAAPVRTMAAPKTNIAVTIITATVRACSEPTLTMNSSSK